MAPTLEVVVAYDVATRGIGAHGALPWRLPADMARFKRLTRGRPATTPPMAHAVIMGRRTWCSIPDRRRPLPGRRNVVLTRDPALVEVVAGVHTADSLAAALDLLGAIGGVERVFVIGGEQVYAAAMQLASCTVLHVTRVLAAPGAIEYDAFFPPIDAARFQEIDVSDPIDENGVQYEFATLIRRPGAPLQSLPPAPQVAHEEGQYLDLIRRVLAEGLAKEDRTGVGTIALFGSQMRFDLSGGRFPLLTTKRVFWRGLAEELLWFVRGSTNANLLAAKGVHIWDGNGSRSFLDNLGFADRPVGDLGPVYGFQWRHFGAPYTGMNADYTGEGIDQLAKVIDMIKNEPDSRRIIMTAWNPTDLPLMALPPCHMFCQFFVQSGRLSCLMYQRSADLGLGVPFNIASYALLTRMIAHVCDLQPGEFIHCLGDAHIYSNHVAPLKVQIERTPRPFPTLTIRNKTKDIDGFAFDDFVLEGYCPHPSIKMDMAV